MVVAYDECEDVRREEASDDGASENAEVGEGSGGEERADVDQREEDGSPERRCLDGVDGATDGGVEQVGAEAGRVRVSAHVSDEDCQCQ